jgi:hypothetical protein
LKSVLVDKRAFMSPRLEYRLRFSVAHEIGHLVLYRDYRPPPVINPLRPPLIKMDEAVNP